MARREIIAIYILKKDVLPEARPSAENIKKAILHIRSCDFCKFWFRDSCCGHIRETYSNFQYPPPASDSVYTLDRLHGRMHEALGIELVVSEHQRN